MKTNIIINSFPLTGANYLSVCKRVEKALHRQGHKKDAADFKVKVAGITQLDVILEIINIYVTFNTGGGGYQ